jgi:hypothetical protein
MKYTIFILLICITCVVFLCRCNRGEVPNNKDTGLESGSETETVYNSGSNTDNEHLQYKYPDTSDILFHEIVTDQAILDLDENTAQEILKIVNRNGWEFGYPKSLHDYRFDICESKEELYYSVESKLLQDKKRNRVMFLYPEEQELINSLIFKNNIFGNQDTLSVSSTVSSEYVIEVSEEERKKILSVLNGSKWTVGTIEHSKIIYDICIEFGDDRVIFYSSKNYIFKDEDNSMHLLITFAQESELDLIFKK